MLIRWDNEITALDIKILRLDQIKRTRILPYDYIMGEPAIGMDENDKYLRIYRRDSHVDIKEGDVVAKTIWYNEILPAIKEAGDRLHEIMKHAPKQKNNRIVTVII